MSRESFHFVRAACVLLALTLLLVPGCRKGPDKLVFGYVQPASSNGAGTVASTQAGPLARPAEALGKAMSKSLGIPIQMFAFGTPTELARALSAGQADIGVMNPMAYVVAHRDGAQVILKATLGGSDSYNSVIFARFDAGIETLAGLQGKTVAFVDPASRAGYLYPAAFLIRNGVVLDNASAVFKGDTTAVVKAVLDGEVAAGACEEGAFVRACGELPGASDTLEILGRTAPIPYDTVAVRSGLNSSLVERVKQALIAAIASPEGGAAWQELSRYQGVVEAQERDYDVIREMAELLGFDLEVLADGG